MSQARELLDHDVRIVDLAADFRLQDTQAFEKWYKLPHACPDVLAESVYGLAALNRDQIAKARVVGNPGCYPTTFILGLLPLIEHGRHLIDTAHIIADCKSVTYGAWLKSTVGNLYSARKRKPLNSSHY